MRSAFRSKWFSIEALPGPVTKSTCLVPTRVSSSTTYCTTGLRPTGSISFGWDLVAGNRRVPRPATGTTAISISMGLPTQGRGAGRGAPRILSSPRESAIMGRAEACR